MKCSFISLRRRRNLVTSFVSFLRGLDNKCCIIPLSLDQQENLAAKKKLVSVHSNYVSGCSFANTDMQVRHAHAGGCWDEELLRSLLVLQEQTRGRGGGVKASQQTLRGFYLLLSRNDWNKLV